MTEPSEHQPEDLAESDVDESSASDNGAGGLPSDSGAEVLLSDKSAVNPSSDNNTGSLPSDNDAGVMPSDNGAVNPSSDNNTGSLPSDNDAGGLHGVNGDGVMPSDNGAVSPPSPTKLTSADKIKFAGLIAFFILIALIGINIARIIGALDNDENAVEALTVAIREAGVLGILICIGLQFLQVVVAVVPGQPVQAAIGLVYGTLGGGLVTLLGVLISTVFVYYLVRWLGAPFVQAMIGKQGSKQSAAIQRFLTSGKRLNAAVFILYFIPGLPKDIFTYIVPLTPMRPEEFFVLSTLARAPAVFATTFVVDAFNSGNYIACLIVAILFGGMGLIGIVFNMKIIEFADRIVNRVSHYRDEIVDVFDGDDKDDDNKDD